MDLKEIATYIVIILIGIVVAQHMNVVVSGSMEPVMYRGDIVIVDKNPSSVQVGDIVVYKATWINEDVIHRVKEIYKTSNGSTYLIMKGDNNQVADPYPVQYPDQVVSKVVSINGQPLIIPKIGYISLWIKGL
ncbi:MULTISPECIES: signal peptidase I [Methanobacterium]|uniref:S26 family signal peptidase n=1 Tax=Methanobacterium bryantii TaxID=2161 RepID=A0A2A2H5P7_METBR|nr:MULTISPECIES: signal peptidase I [Methanobacterium]OEC88771.1 signal peptidase I [Methanobacterium sp. A39]PAV04781.1 S26 family signal peptidase [Methanobacterium bryantii]